MQQIKAYKEVAAVLQDELGYFNGAEDLRTILQGLRRGLPAKARWAATNLTRNMRALADEIDTHLKETPL